LDAGFPRASEELLAALEANGTPYIARLRAKPALDRLSAASRKRPRGRPPHEPRLWCVDLSYQAGSWSTPRRVILVLKERAEGRELDRFELVTSVAPERMTAEEVLAPYRYGGIPHGRIERRLPSRAVRHGSPQDLLHRPSDRQVQPAA
jgi:hypothetical protein